MKKKDRICSMSKRPDIAEMLQAAQGLRPLYTDRISVIVVFGLRTTRWINATQKKDIRQEKEKKGR